MFLLRTQWEWSLQISIQEETDFLKEETDFLKEETDFLKEETDVFSKRV
jgi:hypothetical protein